MADPVFSYTGRDFSTEFERLLVLFRQILPEYTDLNPSDAGRTLVELLARQTDLLNLYIDRVAQEQFISTAIHKSSLIQLGKIVDYLPKLASPASTRIRITRLPGVERRIPIPKYTEFSRPDGLLYHTVEAAALEINQPYVDVDVIQGTLVTATISPGQFQSIDWTGFPKFNLGANVVNELFDLRHGTNPVFVWAQVESLWRSTSMDQHFLLELDGDDDTVWLVLGDGSAGQGPPAGEQLTVKYIRTDASTGNCGAGVITGIPDFLTDLVSVSNIEQATGGGGAETREAIRRAIPRMARTQRRGLTAEDYETLIQHIPGVLHVQALDRESDSQFPYFYEVICVVPEGGGPISTYLRSEIMAQCQQWGHLGDWSNRYIVRDCTQIVCDVTARIGVARGYDTANCIGRVTAALETVFLPENLSIGSGIDVARLYQAVAGLAGLNWIEIDTPADSLPGIQQSIYVKGVVSITPEASLD